MVINTKTRLVQFFSLISSLPFSVSCQFLPPGVSARPVRSRVGFCLTRFPACRGFPLVSIFLPVAGFCLSQASSCRWFPRAPVFSSSRVSSNSCPSPSLWGSACPGCWICPVVAGGAAGCDGGHDAAGVHVGRFALGAEPRPHNGSVLKGGGVGSGFGTLRGQDGEEVGAARVRVWVRGGCGWVGEWWRRGVCIRG